MIPYYLDLVLRVGRLMGTIRSLIVQTEQLIDFVDLRNVSDVFEVDGQDL